MRNINTDSVSKQLRVIIVLFLASLLMLSFDKIILLENTYTLGIHSRADIDDDGISGHAWITLTTVQPDGTKTVDRYGLWPDDHPSIQAAGLDNGNGSDVRQNFSGDTFRGLFNRYYALTEEQKNSLIAFVSQNRKWTCTYTCASFASDAIKHVVGEDVDADDATAFPICGIPVIPLIGVETPRELSKSIQELEEDDPTSELDPNEGEPGGGSSGSDSSLSSFDNSPQVTGQCCEVVSIPTLSQWGLITLALLTLIIGIISIRQEEKATA